MLRLVLSAVLVAGGIGGATASFAGGSRADGPADSPALAAAQQPLAKDGWWIRVNPTNQATNLYWRFGSASNRLGAPVNWVKGKNPDEVDLPAGQRGLETIHVAALSLPPKETASFCLFFGDQGVELFEFVREKNAEVAQSKRDPACVP